MKKIIIAIVVVLVVAGGGFFFMNMQSENSLKTFASSILAFPAFSKAVPKVLKVSSIP
jgi:flagellar basal body-associated protein FliL